jgi:hypothetical protein
MQSVDIKLSARSFCFLPGYVLPPQGDPLYHLVRDSSLGKTGKSNLKVLSLVVVPISISTTKASFVGENLFVRSLLGVVHREGKPPFLRSDFFIKTVINKIKYLV